MFFLGWLLFGLSILAFPWSTPDEPSRWVLSVGLMLTALILIAAG